MGNIQIRSEICGSSNSLGPPPPINLVCPTQTCVHCNCTPLKRKKNLGWIIYFLMRETAFVVGGETWLQQCCWRLLLRRRSAAHRKLIKWAACQGLPLQHKVNEKKKKLFIRCIQFGVVAEFVMGTGSVSPWLLSVCAELVSSMPCIRNWLQTFSNAICRHMHVKPISGLSCSFHLRLIFFITNFSRIGKETTYNEILTEFIPLYYEILILVGVNLMCGWPCIVIQCG